MQVLNPHKRHLAVRPEPRHRLPSLDLKPHVADRDALQAIVNRRLALRLGLSLPVAAVISSLAGLGPRDERVAR